LEKIHIDLKIIGIVHSSFKFISDVPKIDNNQISKIEVFDKYQNGLKDIEGFSHIHIFYWLHKSKGYSLHVNTPWDNIPHGLFTTRSPNRPNPIGHTTVELVEKEGNILIVKGLDAIDGTPIIDIKPYVKKFDFHDKIISGWIEKTNLK
jgi:formylmethanofuran dehydrogenase subunit E